MSLHDVIHPILESLDQDPDQDQAIDFLVRSNVPGDLINELSCLSIKGFVKIGKVSLDSLSTICKANVDPMNKRCLPNKFLIIGSGMNGDPIAVNLVNKKIAYLDHDMLWDEDEEEPFENCVECSGKNLPEFALSAMNDSSHPTAAFEIYEQRIAEQGDSGGTPLRGAPDL